jgi:hypothetical protein
LSQHRPAPDSKKILKPPLRQFPMTDVRWLEDLLPEYLWAAGFVAGDADAGLFRLARVLDAMTTAIADGEAPLLDGTLSSLEALTEAQRAKVMRRSGKLASLPSRFRTPSLTPYGCTRLRPAGGSPTSPSSQTTTSTPRSQSRT